VFFFFFLLLRRIVDDSLFIQIFHDHSKSEMGRVPLQREELLIKMR